MRCRFVTDFRDFNPLPRKEGDTNCNWIAAGNDISIHSLVKRETETTAQSAGYTTISIHSLVKRETERLETYSGKLVISIHSLVKRETPSGQASKLTHIFQSTPS